MRISSKTINAKKQADEKHAQDSVYEISKTHALTSMEHSQREDAIDKIASKISDRPRVTTAFDVVMPHAQSDDDFDEAILDIQAAIEDGPTANRVKNQFDFIPEVRIQHEPQQPPMGYDGYPVGYGYPQQQYQAGGYAPQPSYQQGYPQQYPPQQPYGYSQPYAMPYAQEYAYPYAPQPHIQGGWNVPEYPMPSQVGSGTNVGNDSFYDDDEWDGNDTQMRNYFDESQPYDPSVFDEYFEDVEQDELDDTAKQGWKESFTSFEEHHDSRYYVDEDGTVFDMDDWHDASIEGSTYYRSSGKHVNAQIDESVMSRASELRGNENYRQRTVDDDEREILRDIYMEDVERPHKMLENIFTFSMIFGFVLIPYVALQFVAPAFVVGLIQGPFVWLLIPYIILMSIAALKVSSFFGSTLWGKIARAIRGD